MEFKPLFKPGFHDVTFDRIAGIFVDPFSNSKQRKLLFTRLKAFLKKLKEVGANFEIWIDGSFATTKENPADIDIVIIGDQTEINKLPSDKSAILNKLLNNLAVTKLRYKCDVYFIPKDDMKARSYWRGWFGFSRNESAKGIPRLRMKDDYEFNKES